jgi:hypothetical protein
MEQINNGGNKRINFFIQNENKFFDPDKEYNIQKPERIKKNSTPK